MTGELGTRREALARATCALGLLGHATIDELRDLDIDCEAADLARLTAEASEPALRCTPDGFEVPDGEQDLRRSMEVVAERWPDLGLRVAERLCGRGEFDRAGTLLGELMDRVDVCPVVHRHVFDLLNVGQIELIESLVFDEAFEAPEWLRETLSAVEGLLWSGFRGYRQEARRAREVQASIERAIEAAPADGWERRPLAQAWSLLDLYASWEEPIATADVLPRDVAHEDDDFVRCLWVLRRARQLAALGRLDEALPILEAADPLVPRTSLLGAHLSLDRFLVRTLLGESPEGEGLNRLRHAARFVSSLHLDLLELSIDGYREAVLAFVGSGGSTGDLPRLAERSAIHPDPMLHGALSIACAASSYRRHSFYAALTHVRDTALRLGYLGATDLVCAAYILETLCQGAVGEEPAVLPEPSPDRPSALGLLPLARCAYGAAQEIYRVAEELDPESLSSRFDDGKPSYVAVKLTGLVLRGSWPQALALSRAIPYAWQEAARVEEGDETLGSRRGAPRTSRGGSPDAARTDAARVVVRRVMPPKLDLRMLGAFEVWVGERKVSDDRWRRKAGRMVIQALIVAPSHSLTRASLCDGIWPDRDYLSSRNNLYSVLSCVRGVLGCADREPAYLICEEGKVSLNPKLVECDVDNFERRCREVLAHEGDRPWRLGLCRQLGESYKGGLVIPSQDVHGEFQARRQALESLYVDVLVEAADLALKTGLAKEALWFANDACDRGDLREDAVSCRLRALAADGRARELDDAYKRYCTELSDDLYMAPSARMRTLYANLRRYVQDASAAVADRSIGAYEEALGTVA